MSHLAIISAESTGELSTEVGNPWANIGIFLVFVAITLFAVLRASKKTKTAADFYAGGRSFTGTQNGTAIAGDYLSAASFLGIVGAIAIYGYDGFLYSIGFLVAWLVALLLVAEMLRNTGKFTMADVLSFRLKQRPVRIAAATSTLAISIFYLLAQMAGAGALVSLLLGIDSKLGQSLVIAVVGVLMIFYVFIGGMKGTTWVQIIKATLLLIGVGIMSVWMLGLFGFNFSAMLGEAASVAGLTITASASFAHDIYGQVIKKGNLDARGEMRAGRVTVVVVGILAILGGIGAQGQNVAFLVALAFAVAASANLPTIIFSLFWKKFTTRGALWSMYGGLLSSITLILVSPVLWGAESSFFPDMDLAIYPLTNPGIVSIPLSFLLGWLGSVTSKTREDVAKQAEMEVRSLTGVGAEEATDH